MELKSVRYLFFVHQSYRPRDLFMKLRSIFLYCPLLLLLCLCSSTMYAAQLYVKPSAEVPVRRGQGTEYKIVAVVADGTMVTLLEENEGWARVQLKSGKQGWILKRYLSSDKPLQDQVAALTQAKIQLKEQLTKTDGRLTELLQVHNKTEQELTDCMARRDTIKADYQRLQQDTADVVLTKKKLAETQQQLSELTNRMTDLQLENTGLKKSSALIWFLVGAGVLLTGWCIGLLTGKRTKKRRSSLL